MTLSPGDFTRFHNAVHGRPPFAWQQRLLEQVVHDRAWPSLLDLPTGVGKTTCIDIALFSLALNASAHERWCPRRIAMVVDRRVVVDQAAERGRKLARALTGEAADSVVLEVGRRLRSLSKDLDDPVAVFTLRGGMPKDDGWARSPDQPLILCSTVDQLGSRLLMQGYGVSKGMRPVHAGLLGNDTLLLLDEVHLSQAFAETLEQLKRLRCRFEASSVRSRFCAVFMSATPGAQTPSAFRLTEVETAGGSPLQPRLRASKRTTIVEGDGRISLEHNCVERARAFIGRHRVVAVVVNRVASAATIVRQLREMLPDVDVALLTGRMRPIDRDDALASLRDRILTGRDRQRVERPLIVVGTQCIEAGADFDFDAMVTEAASIDALRQRFGRVDRLGEYGRAEGAIIWNKEPKDDPIYGNAIAATLVWLKARLDKKTKSIDFGVLALPTPAGPELRALLAPSSHAPVLLPAYLDLWVQSSPEARELPDVSLWLHGERSGPADVQLVWRADLLDADLAAARLVPADNPARDRPTSIVASVRPSSLESISVPFVAALRWMQGRDPGEIADVEVASRDDAGVASKLLALRWAGDDSEVIDATQLRPGDTIVVPAVRGGIRDGSFDGSAHTPVVDLAERASFFGRGQPALRVHARVLDQLALSGMPDDVGDAREYLGTLALEAEGWRREWLLRLGRGRESIVVEGIEPWVVLRGRRVNAAALRRLLSDEASFEDGVELTTDDDDSSYAGRAVSLAEHSSDVEGFARTYARAAGLPDRVIEDIALAGWVHDIGKADRRFQLLLRLGSEIELLKDETPLAKSAMPPGARSMRRLAQARSGYPEGCRHEVQSVALLEAQRALLETKAFDPDLVLHLVASHHGHCRPIAPAVIDAAPVDVTLPDHASTVFGTVSFPQTSSRHDLHRLSSPLAHRFWRLVEKYGWLELCWLEAILRLADHRASEAEQAQEHAS